MKTTTTTARTRINAIKNAAQEIHQFCFIPLIRSYAAREAARLLKFPLYKLNLNGQCYSG